ncbi:MAG: hypothetical protein WCO33_01025 [bacterium]
MQSETDKFTKEDALSEVYSILSARRNIPTETNPTLEPDVAFEPNAPEWLTYLGLMKVKIFREQAKTGINIVCHEIGPQVLDEYTWSNYTLLELSCAKYLAIEENEWIIGEIEKYRKSLKSPLAFLITFFVRRKLAVYKEEFFMNVRAWELLDVIINDQKLEDRIYNCCDQSQIEINELERKVRESVIDMGKLLADAITSDYSLESKGHFINESLTNYNVIRRYLDDVLSDEEDDQNGDLDSDPTNDDPDPLPQ